MHFVTTERERERERRQLYSYKLGNTLGRIDSGGASTGSYIALTNQGDAHKLIGGWPNLAKKMAICENILTMHTHAAQERRKAKQTLIRACYGCTYLTHFSTVGKQCNHLHFALFFAAMFVVMCVCLVPVRLLLFF